MHIVRVHKNRSLSKSVYLPKIRNRLEFATSAKNSNTYMYMYMYTIVAKYMYL